MRNIKKTFSLTAIHACACYVLDGKAKLCELPAALTFEKVTDKNAAEIVIDEITREEIVANIGTDDFKIIVESVEPSGEVVYTMSAKDFMKYGTADSTDTEETETEE